jgi:LmbE family N-acetylglucosaminyl deacetylase
MAAVIALLLAAEAGAYPRPHDPMDASRLRLALQRLQVTGTALFVAAHPDDENTSFLAYLSQGRKVRTAYLSMTRGDGGQNLIGSETGDALGVIRTHELLAARRIDGAEQYFTRAVDFGYSKSADETLEFWGRQRVLADVVRVIRALRPDVIVTRFPTDGAGGHGHHTASAILAEEAFVAAADPARFPEQLRELRPWQARRLVWNVFRFGSAGPDTSRTRLRVDLGAYEPLLGRSYTEIAGVSRSMHKSQGFGSAERRGTWENTLEHRLGDPATRDLFDGVDLTWRRVRGGERVASLLARAEREFDPAHPSRIVPVLLEARSAMAALPTEPWIEAKRAELVELIRSCLGLWVEAVAARATATPGSALPVTFTVLHRSAASPSLRSIALPGADVRLGAGAGADSGAAAAAVNVPLAENRPLSATAVVTIPADAAVDQPYWLREPGEPGAYAIADGGPASAPQNPPAMTARVVIGIGADTLGIAVPVVHRWIDPVEGERWRTVQVVPPVTFRFDRGVYLFRDGSAREIRVVAESADSSLAGEVSLAAPDGWAVTPASAAVRFTPDSPRAELRFRLTPGTGSGTVRAGFRGGDRTYSHRLVPIEYTHVPVQSLFPPAEARLVRTDADAPQAAVGYVMGSGDAVPEALGELGFRVTALTDDDLEGSDLSRFGAVVVGVRSFNTRPRLRAAASRLLRYAEDGGRLVVQYQTAEAAIRGRIGPLPLTISRDRVSVEDAPVRLLRPDHPLLTSPNRIGPGDFTGWVQERGLYFASPFDTSYDALLASADPGEPDRTGGLLYARHGRGDFVYTGLSFFRQLPAGVPGAYRLLANLVSPANRR